MGPSDIFTIGIINIISVEERRRTVAVTMDIDFYGGPYRGEVAYFRKTDWDCIKRAMKYDERRTLTKGLADKYDNMTDEELLERRFAARISDFTDKELVDEVNRRIQSLNRHNIAVEAKLVLLSNGGTENG